MTSYEEQLKREKEREDTIRKLVAERFNTQSHEELAAWALELVLSVQGEIAWDILPFLEADNDK